MALEASIDVAEENYQKALDAHDEGRVAELYQEWALNGQYDKDTIIVRHRGPTIIAEELEKLFINDRDRVKIIDIGAGTGDVAKELRRRGYTRLDAVEPVSEMSDYAWKTNLYEKYICDFLSDKPLDVEAGGYIIMVGAGKQYYRLPELHHDLAQEMYRLETENKMRIMKREHQDGYLCANSSNSSDGMLFVIRKI